MAYLLFAAATFSAIFLLHYRSSYQPIALLLVLGLVLDASRALVRLLVLAPLQSVSCGYSGALAGVFLGSELGYLAWSAGVVAVMLRFFFRDGERAVLWLSAVTTGCLVVFWPFPCAGLDTFHTFLHGLGSLVFVGCLAKLLTSSVFSLECVSALALGSTEVLLLVGPYSLPDAATRWSLAILGYEIVFVILTLLQIGALPCRSISPPWFNRFKNCLRPFESP